MSTIILDAGHRSGGGHRRGGFCEHTFVRSVVRLCVQLGQEKVGDLASFIATDPRLSYTERAHRLREWSTHLDITLIHVHVDADWGDPNMRGTWAVYKSNPISKVAAMTLTDPMFCFLSGPRCNLPADSIFTVPCVKTTMNTFRRYICPTTHVWLELGFISNDRDFAALTAPDAVDKAAESIIQALFPMGV